jgi:hypothetical protein
MSMYHALLDSGRWFKFSLMEQLANIGSEVERAIRSKNENPTQIYATLYRVLDLVDLTILDAKNRKRLKEIVRFREVFIDYLLYDNAYNFTDQYWQNYFYYFSYVVISEKRKNL